MDASKRPEENPQPGPGPFHGIAVHFSHAISIVVAGILSLGMTHSVMRTSRFAHMIIGRGLVRINRRGTACGAFHLRLNRLLLRVLTHG
jgi:hypothetical protein